MRSFPAVWGDNMTIAKEKNANVLSAALKWLWQIREETNCPTVKMPSVRAKKYLLEHPRLRESATYMLHCNIQRMAGVGPLVPCHYLMSKKDKTLADLFWGEVGNGEGLRKNGWFVSVP